MTLVLLSTEWESCNIKATCNLLNRLWVFFFVLVLSFPPSERKLSHCIEPCLQTYMHVFHFKLPVDLVYLLMCMDV